MNNGVILTKRNLKLAQQATAFVTDKPFKPV